MTKVIIDLFIILVLLIFRDIKNCILVIWSFDVCSSHTTPIPKKLRLDSLQNISMFKLMKCTILRKKYGN